MNTTCQDMQERITDFVLGALDDAGQVEVRDHLGHCRACREYLEHLEAHDEALIVLGRHVQDGMEARQEKVIQALANAPCVGSTSCRPAFLWIRFARVAVAAAIILVGGIAIGRVTSPAPLNVEQLRADLQATVDRRLESALLENRTQIRTELVDEVRQELMAFGAQLTSNSKQALDQQFDQLVQLLEAARLKDRQRVARAFEHIELNRVRDAQRIGRGLYTLATQTTELPTSIEN